MFDFVRSNTRLLQFLLLLLIVPSFVFFGVQGYSKFKEGAAATVAKVDGREITQQEWDVAHQRQVERVRRQMPNVDAKLFDSPEMKRQTLDVLVREHVMVAAAHDSHFAVSDDRVQQAFRTDPQFAPLRNPDNSINRPLLEAQGMSAEMLVQQLRQELTLRQVLQPQAESVFAGPGAARPTLDALLQKREVQVQRFDAKALVAKVQPSDADIEAYYKANEAQFRAPEQATIEYVVLDLDALKKRVSVSEEDLRKYYEENAGRYTSAQERRASHILVKADKDAPAAERQKAKAKAEELLAQVRKNPDSFAEVAKKNSDDPGSAARGGDLDFFGRGAMVKPFEDAVFAMNAGEISNVIETDFGYHIIKLVAVRGGDKKPFEAVRAGIEDEVRRQLAQKRYSESADQFTNTVYEQSDSLQPVIDKLQLEKKTAVVQRTPAPGVAGALASPKLLEAVFGNDAIKNKRNIDAVEVGPSQMASARVTQYTPARTLPLAEVKEAVRQRVVVQQAAAQARKDGEARLAQLKQGADVATLPTAVWVSRDQTQGLSPAVVDAVLRADTGKLPAVIGVPVGDEGFAVARITQVQAPQLEGDRLKELQTAYARAWGAAETQAYFEALKSRFKTEVKVANPADAAASAATR
jgi:peptidyl-prolyl cis-trans isomerase D